MLFVSFYTVIILIIITLIGNVWPVEVLLRSLIYNKLLFPLLQIGGRLLCLRLIFLWHVNFDDFMDCNIQAYQNKIY